MIDRRTNISVGLVRVSTNERDKSRGNKLKKTGLPVYLDHNASTPVLPEVVDAMLPYLREHFGNPSSTHVYGKT